MSASMLPHNDARDDLRAALCLALVLALPAVFALLAWARGEGWW
jgi:peptidoglycan biosynthesis protein MviN/MurJ (putative lipid II flippase)